MTKKKAVNLHEVMMVDIMKTANFLDSKLNGLLKEYDLTNVQYNIMRILRGAYPETLGVGEVKNRMSFSNSDVSRLIDRLVTKGLVKREVCPENRRKMDVSISQIGLQILEKIDVELNGKTDSFFSKIFTTSEAVDLSEKLRLIREHNSKK